MATWEDIRNDIVLPILKDETPLPSSGRAPRYDLDTVRSWWNNGQGRMATMRPLQRHQIYKDDGVVVHLPENHYKPRALYIEGIERPIPRSTIVEQYTNSMGSPCYYIDDDKLIVANTGQKSVNFIYVYNAYYKRITQDNDIVEVPEWAWEAGALYVAMQAATREAMADARYRKFATKTDAGTPIHNPFLGVAKWLEQRFENIIKLHVDDDEDYA
ncbi:MAG: hypothetical protein DSY80_07820 [Desulfocapsa sp.]|nr:MAG: hypothetical protein DSY80_07820 [Desulfocapsa sp.]